jgi:hypothetical protein
MTAQTGKHGEIRFDEVGGENFELYIVLMEDCVKPETIGAVTPNAEAHISTELPTTKGKGADVECIWTGKSTRTLWRRSGLVKSLGISEKLVGTMECGSRRAWVWVGGMLSRGQVVFTGGLGEELRAEPKGLGG